MFLFANFLFFFLAIEAAFLQIAPSFRKKYESYKKNLETIKEYEITEEQQRKIRDRIDNALKVGNVCDWVIYCLYRFTIVIFYIFGLTYFPLVIFFKNTTGLLTFLNNYKSGISETLSSYVLIQIILSTCFYFIAKYSESKIINLINILREFNVLSEIKSDSTPPKKRNTRRPSN